MNRIITLSLILPWIALSTFAAQKASCPVIPLPQESSRVDAEFRLSARSEIRFAEPFEAQAFLLQQELLRYCGIPVSMAPDLGKMPRKANTVLLTLSRKVAGTEGYSLNMSASAVEISAASGAGMVNGVMTLLQLARLSALQAGTLQLPCWNIQDEPAYSWRGFMLDESRHFFGKKKVKQILDWMALYHLNHFHWHLTDSPGWRIEVTAYPRLAYVGGIGNYDNENAPAQYYTQDEIREIVAYAAARNIAIVPEIDMPGHASAAVRAYPEFSGGGSARFPNYTFNPGKDTVYTFLTNVLREIDALFPSQIIHLGGDEVHYGNEDWNTDEAIQALIKRQGLKSLPEVETYFFNRMADSLLRMHNKLAAWDEVADSDFPPDQAIMYYWRQNKPEQLQKSLDKGYGVVFCPRLPMYLDYPQDTLQVHGVDWRRFPQNTYRDIYAFDPMGFDVKYPARPNILGIQANLWTERIVTGNRVDYMLFPRIAALAEAAWTRKPARNLEQFEARLKLQFPLYRKDKIYFLNVFNPRETGEPIN